MVQAFSIKKGEMQVTFKTLPGEPITCLELGGTTGTFARDVFILPENLDIYIQDFIQFKVATLIYETTTNNWYLKLLYV